jgi:hypothetical protein
MVCIPTLEHGNEKKDNTAIKKVHCSKFIGSKVVNPEP